RMGSRRLARDGNAADQGSGLVLRAFATGLCLRISAGSDRLLAGLSTLRLARTFCRGRNASSARSFHSQQGSGIARVAARKNRSGESIPPFLGDGPSALASFPLRDSAHDSIQLHVARHPGPLSYILAKAVWARCLP